jgi:Asp-tRNA(Asn)/Glu-tRNA(Gln) amidotransferase B subunit
METVLWRYGNTDQDHHYLPEPDLGILLISRDEVRAYSELKNKTYLKRGACDG